MPWKDPERAREYFKEYNKKHYATNMEYYQQKREERKNVIRQMKEKPCSDCGVEYPWYVMEFDHTEDNKIGAISNLLRDSSLANAVQEAQKCEVLCANCHAIRTYKRSIA